MNLLENQNQIIVPEKSYDGILMEKGRKAEEVVIQWLRNLRDSVKEVIDVREWRITQRLDVDCIIESRDGKLILAEIKSDSRLQKSPNFLFEYMRINHFAPADSIHYLGWVFRSPAKYLLYYSPNENSIYKFSFENIRKIIGKWVADQKTEVRIVCTDKQKTTFNFIVPKIYFFNSYKRYEIGGN